MFLYKEYNKYLVQINISEKTKFYTYLYIMKLKKIVILLKYISIRYTVLPSMYSMISAVRNVLFFNNFLNYKLLFKYNNATKDFHKIYIGSNFIYKYNMFYFFYIGYLNKEYTDLFFLERKQKNIRTKLYTNYKISFYKLSNISTSAFFSEIKSVSSTVSICCYTNTNNYYLNKLFFSHTLLNLL